MCITMQEQVAYFKKRCENTFDGRKIKQPSDINIPVRAMAETCVAFRPGERYLFAPKENKYPHLLGVNILRNNLLWKLAKQGESIAVYGDNLQFEKDFWALLSLESNMLEHHIQNAIFAPGEHKKLLEALERLKSWKIEWNLVADLEDAQHAPICFISLNQANWKEIWPKETKAVLLGFLDEDALNGKDGLSAIHAHYELAFPNTWADYLILGFYSETFEENTKGLFKKYTCFNIDCIDTQRLIHTACEVDKNCLCSSHEIYITIE